MAQVAHATKWLYGWVAALSLGVASAQSVELAQRVDDALEDLRARRNVPAARDTLAAVIDSAAFRQLDYSQQGNALSAVAISAAEANDYARAHSLMRRATELPAAAPVGWSLRAGFAFYADDFEDAVASFTRLAEQWPQLLSRYSSSTVHQFAAAANRLPDDEAKVRLLTALFRQEWRGPHGTEPSDLWRQLALALLERGRINGAREVVVRIAHPMALVSARADRRFDSLVASSPGLFDVAAAAAREISRLEDEIASSPDSIYPIYRLAGNLEQNNRCAESLALAEKAIARTASPTAEDRPYIDGSEYFVWLLDQRARALACLGQWDDALRRRAQAARLTEQGSSNTSQALNLASLFVELERPTEALEVLTAIGPTSDYGKMVEESVRLGAYAQLGNADGVQTALAYLREHRDDSLDIYQEALLEVGDTDAAAELFIERLDDPVSRAAALEAVQEYAEKPQAPNTAKRNAHLKTMLARSDVRAAIERVGRIESYPYLLP